MTKLCPDTIRACIEALPEPSSWFEKVAAVENSYRAMCQNNLVALLPDPAEELVSEWTASEDYAYGDQSTAAFARWLISSGKMKGE